MSNNSSLFRYNSNQLVYFRVLHFELFKNAVHFNFDFLSSHTLLPL